MKKTKLKTGELLHLSQELPTLLNEKISFTLKYQINKLITSIEGSIKAVEKVRTELLDKFAKPDGEQYKFNSAEDGKKFNEEYTLVLEQDEEIEHPAIKLSDFSELKSETAYRVVFKLIDEG